MHRLKAKKLDSDFSKFSVIFVPVYLTSVCGVMAQITSLQGEDQRLFQAKSGIEF